MEKVNAIVPPPPKKILILDFCTNLGWIAGKEEILITNLLL